MNLVGEGNQTRVLALAVSKERCQSEVKLVGSQVGDRTDFPIF